MELIKREVGDIVVLEMAGELIGGPDAGLLNEKLHELIDAGRTKVVVDLAQVDWMNSSGLGILIAGLTTLRNNGGDMKLAKVSERIQNLLTVTKLTSVFETFNSVNEAVQSYG